MKMYEQFMIVEKGLHPVLFLKTGFFFEIFKKK